MIGSNQFHDQYFSIQSLLLSVINIIALDAFKTHVLLIHILNALICKCYAFHTQDSPENNLRNLLRY